jgi:hypothetical protein
VNSYLARDTFDVDGARSRRHGCQQVSGASKTVHVVAQTSDTVYRRSVHEATRFACYRHHRRASCQTCRHILAIPQRICAPGSSGRYGQGGIKVLHEKYTKGDIAGAIGIGGANGTNLVCSILRSLPYLVPKVMVSTVAGTAAVQWYVAQSDIAMYPSIGDISLNRITTAIMENAANAVAIAAKNYLVKRKAKSTKTSQVLQAFRVSRVRDFTIVSWVVCGRWRRRLCQNW